ncbi:MAG: hypothetical protein EZS28_049267 [Streblomastix strix]|uniref:Uncharacterized protein n=1 Tax=Streblomastix strix TaxID=222440 RepID=A0A5J4TAD7_9EUKA|nr:MAG: hypothetical protein EZS28_049267 [Streblomastix strix]
MIFVDDEMMLQMDVDNTLPIEDDKIVYFNTLLQLNPFERNMEMIIIMPDLFLLDNLNVEYCPMKDIHLEASKFPGDVGACKVLKKTLNVGNMILNVRFGVSSVLGLTPGCDLDTPRSYLLRIYLDIHAHELGIKFPSNVDAHQEQGELY